MTTLWFALVGAGVIGLAYLVYRRKLRQVPGRINPQAKGAAGPPPPPPVAGNSARPDGGGPASWINAAVRINNAGVSAACAQSKQDPRVCQGISAVNNFVVQDTVVKPAEFAWDNTLGKIF